MNLILCIVVAIFAFGKSANGGDADSKGSDAAKLLVSKQVSLKFAFIIAEWRIKNTNR